MRIPKSNYQGLDLRRLQALVEVVRQGGFTAAAERLHASQSTVSKQIAQLEERLGVALLERSATHVRPTGAGRIVLRHAEIMLKQQRNLFAELDDLKGVVRGELRLGFPQLGGDVLFAPLFLRFQQRYPGVDVQIREAGARMLDEAVLRGELELAATLQPLPEGLEAVPVCEEPMTVLLAATHPLAARERLQLQDLRDVPFLLYERGFALNDLIREACEALGYVPRVVVRSSQVSFLQELVAADLGVLLLPRIVAGRYAHPKVRQVALDHPTLRWSVAFAWQRGAYLSHAARAWLEMVRELQHVVLALR